MHTLWCSIAARDLSTSTVLHQVTTISSATGLHCSRDCVCRPLTNNRQPTPSVSIQRRHQSTLFLPVKPNYFTMQRTLLLILSLFFHFTISQVHAQTEAIPARCLNDDADCSFAFTMVYHYDSSSKKCEHILCAPLPDGDHSFNRFATQEQCQDVCLRSKLTSLHVLNPQC